MDFQHPVENVIKEMMDIETDGIVIKQETKDKVLKKINHRNTPLKLFFEREIVIPVKLIIVVLLIPVIFIIYKQYEIFKITETDIRQNAVYIINYNGVHIDENTNKG
jgi:hypothetical protein